jgi:lipopolysaccharide export system protein LptA
MKKTRLLILSLLVLTALALPALAYKTDRSQPATLDADEFDLDFQTGIRTYRGNVVYQQGSIRLYADELIAYIKDDKLERAVARGNPAKFSQRPDDSETDIVGFALRIELNDVEQIVILQDRAKVTQDANTITGKRIVYNMATEKVKVRSGKRTTPAPLEKSTEDGQTAATQDDSAAQTETSGTNRPRLVIQPRE